MKQLILIIAQCISIAVFSQTLGGNTVYNFLKLPSGAQQTALGTINVSQINDDLSLAFTNPALLNSSMNQQLHVSFNSLYADIKVYHLMGAFHHARSATNVALGVNYLSYGSIAQTDGSGMELGIFRPRDYVVQVSASRKYMERWTYGLSAKFIHSGYGQYRSSGIAFDAAITYFDSSASVQASFLLKNMGSQLTTYQGTSREDLPFDIQVGVSKKLAGAPIQFSLSAYHLHRFDLVSDDTIFNSGNDRQDNALNNIVSHFVFSTQLFLAKKLEISAAYNHLQRRELTIGQSGNGLNGFSLGLGVLFRKFQMRYSRTYYQPGVGTNHLGLNLHFKDYL